MEKEMKHLRLLLLLVTFYAKLLYANNQLFPLPENLKPNVNFWIKIYTQYNDRQFIIHDNKYLNIIYEVVDLDQLFFEDKISEKKKWKTIENIKEEYQKALIELAQKSNINPETLDEKQRYVYELFSPDQSGAIFSAAASRIRAQQGLNNRFKTGLIKSGKYMPKIIETFEKYNLPLELTVLPHVESSFNIRAYSKFGAAGLWQFTRGTGHLFLNINYYVDERFDPEKSTDAAARLLNHNYNELGTWPLAINAYNHGVNGLKRAIEKLGTTDIGVITDTYSSRQYGFASRNFYAEFLAALHIIQNYKNYFGEIEFEKPDEYLVIELPYYIHISALTKQLNITEEEIKTLNPSLRSSVFESPKRLPKGFELRILWREDFKVDQFYAQIPEKEKIDHETKSNWYTVKKGDNLKKIAKKFNTSVEELLVLNDDIVDDHKIYENQIIRIAEKSVAESPINESVTPVTNAPMLDKLEQTKDEIKLAQDIKWYQIRPGDKLDQIAKKFDISIENLMAMNKITDKNKIYSGQLLRLKAEAPPVVDSTLAFNKSKTETITNEGSTMDEAMSKLSANYEERITPTTTSKENKLTNHWYEIRLGDNLEKIAKQFNVSLTDLIKVNNIENKNQIAVGQTLIIPSSADETKLSDFASNLSDNRYKVNSNDKQEKIVVKQEATVDNLMDERKLSDEIYVSSEETLGHFAEWLEIPTRQLRELNNLAFNQEIQLGQKIKIIYSNVRKEEFEQRRMEYHRSLEEDFFSSYQVDGVQIHKLKQGENIWYLCKEVYEVPYWLFIKYNPNINFNRLRQGDEIIIPIIKESRS